MYLRYPAVGLFAATYENVSIRPVVYILHCIWRINRTHSFNIAGQCGKSRYHNGFGYRKKMMEMAVVTDVQSSSQL